MLQINSKVVVTDNSGAKEAKIIGIYGGSKRRYATVGQVVKVTITKATTTGTVKEHELHKALVVRVKKEYRCMDGSYVRFDDNAVVILDGDSGRPKGNRIFGPVAREVKAWGFDEVISLAPEVI